MKEYCKNIDISATILKASKMRSSVQVAKTDPQQRDNRVRSDLKPTFKCQIEQTVKARKSSKKSFLNSRTKMSKSVSLNPKQ